MTSEITSEITSASSRVDSGKLDSATGDPATEDPPEEVGVRRRREIDADASWGMTCEQFVRVYVHFMSRHDSAMARQLVKAFAAFDFSGALLDGYKTVTQRLPNGHKTHIQFPSRCVT